MTIFALTCGMPKYSTCPVYTLDYVKSTLDETTWHHAKNRVLSTKIGASSVMLQSRERNFTIHWKSSSDKSNVYILNNYGDELTHECADINYTFTADVSEFYQCIDSVILHVDTRYDNAVVKEINQTLTFDKTTTDVAKFKQTWGIIDYHKIKVDNARIRTVTTYYVITKGIKTVLSSTDTTVNTVIPIMVVPFPPSQADILDDDIKAGGFYDYMDAPDNKFSQMAQDDGGQDFYYPEWCRRIGTANQTLDIQEAWERWNAGINPDTVPNPVILQPLIATDPFFSGSMSVDRDGNVFYSMLIDGKVFNSLTNGDIEALTGLTAPACYPIAPV